MTPEDMNVPMKLFIKIGKS